MSIVTKAEDWLTDLAGFGGEWQGAVHGAGICVIANRIDGPGGGPRLHKHPYPEIFVSAAEPLCSRSGRKRSRPRKDRS